MNLQSHGMPHCLLFMQYQPWSPMHRRRQLESAALSLASGVHAMSLSWVQAAVQLGQQLPEGLGRFTGFLAACAYALFASQAAHLVHAAVPQLADAVLQLLASCLVRGRRFCV